MRLQVEYIVKFQVLYEGDGESFDYRRGEWAGIEMSWNDVQNVFNLHLADGPKLLQPRKPMTVKVAEEERHMEFDGRDITVHFWRRDECQLKEFTLRRIFFPLLPMGPLFAP